MRLLLLDVPGTVAAVILGIIVIYFSAALAVQNFILLLFFLVISVIATRWRHGEKREKGLYEHERGWKNVISNGSIPAICCIAFWYTGFTGWLVAYFASLAAATADKFGSELGVLSGKPYSLLGFKRVKPGTSGAVSALGTLMSFNGALLISLAAYFLFYFDPFLIFWIAIIGFVGGFIDTIAGIPEEKGIGTKSTSNILCTLAGAGITYFLFTWGIIAL